MHKRKHINTSLLKKKYEMLKWQGNIFYNTFNSHIVFLFRAFVVVVVFACLSFYEYRNLCLCINLVAATKLQLIIE